MKIKVKYQPKTSKILVYHFTGKKAVEDILKKINCRIDEIKKEMA